MNNFENSKPLDTALNEIEALSVCLDNAINTVVNFRQLVNEATQRVIETEFGKHPENWIAGNHEQKIWLQVGYDKRLGEGWWARAINEDQGFKLYAATPAKAIDEALNALSSISSTDAEALKALIQRPS